MAEKNYFWVLVFQLTNHDHWEGEDGCLKHFFFLFVIQQTKDDHGKYLPRTREPIGAPRPLLKLNIRKSFTFTFFVGLVFTR